MTNVNFLHQYQHIMTNIDFINSFKGYKKQLKKGKREKYNKKNYEVQDIHLIEHRNIELKRNNKMFSPIKNSLGEKHRNGSRGITKNYHYHGETMLSVGKCDIIRITRVLFD